MRLVKKLSKTAIAAFSPGTAQVTSGTSFPRSNACPKTSSQSVFTLLIFACNAASLFSTFGKLSGNGTIKSPYNFASLPRKVRAPTSSFGEATQHGTMLCASTTLTERFVSFAKSSRHFKPNRRGEKSVTTALALTSLQNFSISAFGSSPPCNNLNGISRSSNALSTSRRPLSINPNCRAPAPRNFVTTLNTTTSGFFSLFANSMAYNIAQLSFTRWSRLIQ
mmetsp:Transcript_1039/g.3225  ORF Transcript_1039/g.3225 Transcript_1039/m.3225 type:complete len:222 (+) Transcript_1039:897-1562(+)